MEQELLVGVSACILGQEVRYNGGHKLDRFVRDQLGQHVRFVAVCPEVDVGLGVPRPTLRLIQASGDAVRIVMPSTGQDWTGAFDDYTKRKVEELAAQPLIGFVLQSGSPSCGVFGVKVFPPPPPDDGAGGKAKASGMPRRNGRGLFAAALLDRLPDLPVVEDAQLREPRQRENFVARIFAYRRLQQLFRPRWRLGDLVAQHGREKLLLLAHDGAAYRKLGQLVAGGKALPREELARSYRQLFTRAFEKMATPRKVTTVLERIVGQLRKVLEDGDLIELLAEIGSYRSGLVPLIVPLTLIRHYLRRHVEAHPHLAQLAQQTFLDPHPRELLLRNHV